MTQEAQTTTVEKITWLASYPKSGNTWVRAMLAAYRLNGVVDINQLSTMGASDSHSQYMRIVSAMDIDKLGVRGEQWLRPAMLLWQLVMYPIRPMFVKTHNANVIPPNMAPLIPVDMTERAIYIVRDPRDVFNSVTPFLGKTHDEMVKDFNNNSYCISQLEATVLSSQLCSWSTHVKSWTQSQAFPTLVLRYEDMMEDPAGALCSILDFCGQEVDEDRAQRAAAACALEKLRQQEEDHGFKENNPNVERFFNKGGSRWKQEVAYKYIKQIQEDHGEMMAEFGYELADVAGLEAVL